MNLILNIDSSQETAFVCLSANGEVLYVRENHSQKDHAAFLHTAIESLTNESGYTLKQIQAVAVTKGPGSYTGLRVGMSAAKGICYALQLPMIAVSTLEMMAADIIKVGKLQNYLYCPMIDARRMEVFTALYDNSLNEVMSPAAMILDNTSFADILDRQAVCFMGSGSQKFREILNHKNAHFTQNNDLPRSLASLSHLKFVSGLFDDLALTEPLYIKEYKAF